MPTLVRRTWHGDEIQARGRRATGRAAVAMGEHTSGHMVRHAHVLSGLLRRSIHAAKPDTIGEVHADERTVRHSQDRWLVEVGSWVPYACVENNRGGDHRFADLGWQSAEPEFPAILRRAWREEGL